MYVYNLYCVNVVLGVNEYWLKVDEYWLNFIFGDVIGYLYIIIVYCCFCGMFVKVNKYMILFYVLFVFFLCFMISGKWKISIRL